MKEKKVRKVSKPTLHVDTYLIAQAVNHNAELLEGALNRIKELEKVKPCEEGQEPILEKVRAEIEALPKTYPFVNHFDMYVKEDDVKKIIDKY